MSDSGEGRWPSQVAIDETPARAALTAAQYARVSSHGEADFPKKLPSAMRKQFGGFVEKKVIVDRQSR